MLKQTLLVFVKLIYLPFITRVISFVFKNSGVLVAALPSKRYGVTVEETFIFFS